MSLELVFRISLHSDYHVGAGHGDGLADSILLRDGDGQPAIRGSTITGLLRDATWQLLQQGTLHSVEPKCRKSGLTGTGDPPYCAPGAEPCIICRLFGSPGSPKRWRVSSARQVEQPQPGSPGTGELAGGQIVQRVRINPRTRRAEPRKLFSQEYGGGSWTFQFTVTAADIDVAAYEEAALWVAAARAVRGLGRARRRGRGDCRIHLADLTAEAEWLARFRTHWLEGQPLSIPARSTTAVVPPSVPSLAFQGNPVRLRLVARADEPILLSSRGEAGNEFETTSSITGTSLLGALAGRVARRYNLKGGIQGEDQARAAFVELFLRGRARFPSLLPARYNRDDEQLVPAIPAPLDLLTCKAFPGWSELRPCHGVVGYALEPAELKHCPDCARTYQDQNVPLRPLIGLITVAQDPVAFHPARRHEMHIAVDPSTGRVHERDLYGYVSLEAGQYFLGELFCTDEAAWRALQEMADLPPLGEPFPLHIGRASRRGHGQVTMVVEKPQAGEPLDPWRALSLEDRVPGSRASNDLVMTLLADTIVPDGWLRTRTGFDEAWLHELLGAQVEVVRSFARWRVVDGFYNHLGLPRFRDLALTAGSSVGLRFKEDIPADLITRLDTLEQEGLGLRREEGFGQVVFNHPLYDNLQALGGNQVPVPEALWKPATGETQEAIVAKFRRDWERSLNSIDLKTWKKEAYDVVARILRHGATGSLVDLKEALSDSDSGRFGRPRILLGEDLGGPRKEKKLVADTRAGRRKVLELIDLLQQERSLKQHPEMAGQLARMGIELLADRVGQGAAAARLERKEAAKGKHASREVAK